MIPSALTTYDAVMDVKPVSVSRARVEGLISAVSEAIEIAISRSLGFRRFSLVAPSRYRGTGTRSLFVDRWPIRAVERVLVNGSTVDDWLNDPDFLARGELYRVSGWPKVMFRYNDLTGDLNPSTVGYSIELAFTGGFILPQFDQVEDAEHNPTGLSCDLPFMLQEACIDSVLFNLSPPPANLVREKTVGGWDREWSPGGNVPLTGKTMQWIEGFRAQWFG